MTSIARAVTRGFLAGVAGSLAQSAFFRVTRPVQPATPPNAFDPPEPEQRQEPATETVARRLVDDVLQRGPLVGAPKAWAGTAVHLGFGGGWGIDYALARRRFPFFASPAGVAAWASAVWMASDNLLLPAFRLAAWPTRYPARAHAYAWVAHLAYGFAVWAAYDALERRYGLQLAATPRRARLLRMGRRAKADATRALERWQRRLAAVA